MIIEIVLLKSRRLTKKICLKPANKIFNHYLRSSLTFKSSLILADETEQGSTDQKVGPDAESDRTTEIFENQTRANQENFNTRGSILNLYPETWFIINNLLMNHS